jgi:hypothetical protein
MYNAPLGFDPRQSQTTRQKRLALIQVVLLSCIFAVSGITLLGEIGAYMIGYRDMLESSGLIKSIVLVTIVVVGGIGLRIALARFRRPLSD